MNLRTIFNISIKIASNSKHGKFVNFVRYISVLGVMFGTIALIISMSVLSGFETEIKEKAVSFTSHIQIETYKQIGINNYPEFISKIKKDYPIISKAAPVIKREALISSKKDIDGIVLKSISKEFDITNIRKYIKEGNLPEPNAKEILISETMKSKLQADTGDTVIIYYMKSNKEFSSNSIPDAEKFKICGCYQTGMAKYDEIHAFVDYNKLAAMLNISSIDAFGIDLMLKETKAIESVSKIMNENLNYPFIVSNVYELHSSIFAWIDLQKEPIPIVLALISIVAAMNIITILLINVVEKTHTIGILRVMGMSSKVILSIFLIQGVFFGALGSLLGAGISYLFSYLQINYKLISLNGSVYFLDYLPIQINQMNYALVIIASILLSFLVTFIPSIIAMRIKAIKVINFK